MKTEKSAINYEFLKMILCKATFQSLNVIYLKFFETQKVLKYNFLSIYLTFLEVQNFFRNRI